MKDRLVIDISVFTDLDKVGLIEALFKLPCSISISNFVFVREIEKTLGERLRTLGVIIEKLKPTMMSDCERISRAYPKLSASDASLLVLARHGARLVSADKALCSAAAREGVRFNGTLWVIDELCGQECVDCETMIGCLLRLHTDVRCWLPGPEVEKRIVRLRATLSRSNAASAA